MNYRNRREFIQTVGIGSVVLSGVGSGIGTAAPSTPEYQRYFDYEFNIHPSEWDDLDGDTVVLYYTADSRTLVESFQYTLHLQWTDSDEDIQEYHRAGSLRHTPSDHPVYNYETELTIGDIGQRDDFKTESLELYLWGNDFETAIDPTQASGEEFIEIRLDTLPSISPAPTITPRDDPQEHARNLLSSVSIVDNDIFDGMTEIEYSDRYFEFETSHSLDDIIQGGEVKLYYNADPNTLYRTFLSNAHLQTKDGTYLFTGWKLYHQKSSHPDYEYESIRDGVPDAPVDSVSEEEVLVKVVERCWESFVDGTGKLGAGKRPCYEWDGEQLYEGRVLR